MHVFSKEDERRGGGAGANMHKYMQSQMYLMTERNKKIMIAEQLDFNHQSYCWTQMA